MTRTKDGLRYIDSDGHILEHPTAMPDYAPAEYRDRIWHIETDDDGEEWLALQRQPSCRRTAWPLAGTAGFDRRGRSTSVRSGEHALHRGAPGGVQRQGAPPGHGPGRHRPRGAVPDDRCSGCRAIDDVEFAEAQARAYNDWARTTPRRVRAGCSAPARCRRCTTPDDVQAVADEIRRVAELPGMVSVFMRPNPSVDWRPFNDPVYDPIWQAAADTGLPIAFHPFLAPDLPGACVGLQLARPRTPTAATSPTSTRSPTRASEADPELRPNIVLHPGDRQPRRRDELRSATSPPAACASASPTPSSSSSRPTAAGWCRGSSGSTTTAEEVPVGRAVALKMLPSEYFRRQCWISFDPDESMLAFTAQLAAVRRRPHHLGVGLPAPRRQVPRRHRGAGRGARGSCRTSRSGRSPARAPWPSTASASGPALENWG